MKAIHYIASTVAFYRQVLDGKQFTEQEGLDLLGRIPNRGYSYGFMKGTITPDDYSTGESLSKAESLFVGNALAEKKEGKTQIEVRNKIKAGDKLEVLKPDGTLTEITMPNPLPTIGGKLEQEVNNSRFILIEQDLPEYSILRRILNT
jgi:putative protease